MCKHFEGCAKVQYIQDVQKIGCSIKIQCQSGTVSLFQIQYRSICKLSITENNLTILLYIKHMYIPVSLVGGA